MFSPGLSLLGVSANDGVNGNRALLAVKTSEIIDQALVVNLPEEASATGKASLLLVSVRIHRPPKFVAAQSKRQRGRGY